MRYPAWFPYPSSWLNALFLALLSSAVAAGIRSLFRLTLEISITTQSVELFILGAIATLTCPIPTIAFIHHLIHVGLSQLAPQIQPAEIGIVKGKFPGLMSWWEALWSWLVFALSTLIAFAAITIAGQLLGVNWLDPLLESTPEFKRLSGLAGIVWIVFAACLYQIDLLAEKRMVRGRKMGN